MSAAAKQEWVPKCVIRSTRGWNGQSYGQECALHGPFDSPHQRHGQYGIPCPLSPAKSEDES